MLKAPADLVIVEPKYSEKAEGSSIVFVQERDMKTRADMRGVVVSVGPKYKFGLKPGDKVIVRRYDYGGSEGFKIEHDGKEYLSLQPKWVEAVDCNDDAD